ncbi:GT2D2 protein, partial [Atractosteus spatula]|nr:GT2D2 protein [Atractosteus spatula]
MNCKILFQRDWNKGYTVCLIFKESVAVFKEYNLSWHFSTKHANNPSNLTKASYLPAYKIAKQSKPPSEWELLKECMIETADILCPENKSKFEKKSLSRRTVTRRVEVIGEDLACELNTKFYSIFIFYI